MESSERLHFLSGTMCGLGNTKGKLLSFWVAKLLRVRRKAHGVSC